MRSGGNGSPRVERLENAWAGGISLINLNPCNPSALSQPFARWLDFAYYELAPGGDFESSTWTLSGRATLVGRSEPYAATGTPRSLLALVAGRVVFAQSPPTLRGRGLPAVRFFIAGRGLVEVNVVDGGSR